MSDRVHYHRRDASGEIRGTYASMSVASMACEMQGGEAIACACREGAEALVEQQRVEELIRGGAR